MYYGLIFFILCFTTMYMCYGLIFLISSVTSQTFHKNVYVKWRSGLVTLCTHNAPRSTPPKLPLFSRRICHTLRHMRTMHFSSFCQSSSTSWQLWPRVSRSFHYQSDLLFLLSIDNLSEYRMYVSLFEWSCLWMFQLTHKTMSFSHLVVFHPIFLSIYPSVLIQINSDFTHFMFLYIAFKCTHLFIQVMCTSFMVFHLASDGLHSCHSLAKSHRCPSTVNKG